MCIILFIDLDGTLWDSEDISALKPPFTRVSDNTLRDSSGVEVRVFELAIELLKYAKSRGFIVSTLSWNIPEVALEALRVLGLTSLFHYHAIEYHPRKEKMARRLVNALKENGVCTGEPIVIYIDDREIHLEDMKSVFSNLLFIKAWSTCRDVSECIGVIESFIEGNKSDTKPVVNV